MELRGKGKEKRTIESIISKYIGTGRGYKDMY
jgi:hypothetical protein